MASTVDVFRLQLILRFVQTNVVPNDTQYSRFQLITLPSGNCIQPARPERLKYPTFVSEMFRYDADLKTLRYFESDIAETPVGV